MTEKTNIVWGHHRAQKFHSSACNYEWNLERTSNSSQSTHPVGRVYRMSAFERITWGSHITYYSRMFFVAYAFKGHVHMFAGWVKVVSHLSCRTSTISKITPSLPASLGWFVKRCRLKNKKHCQNPPPPPPPDGIFWIRPCSVLCFWKIGIGVNLVFSHLMMLVAPVH